MEKKVLHWLQETQFFKAHQTSIEIQAQFPAGEYIKQLDRRYVHPAYVADFLFVYVDSEKKEHKIIIEYDGFESHFTDHADVNEFNYGEYHTEEHVYREKVLESYGYKFLRINRFNVGKDPVETLDQRIQGLVKKKDRSVHELVATIHDNLEGLQSGRMKECPQCKVIKSIEDFKDSDLITGYGRHCNACKGMRTERKPQTAPDEKTKCPLCKSPMILRKRRLDSRKFFGCSRYPQCKGTRPFS
jgi:very-short-patch-repair endonuclease